MNTITKGLEMATITMMAAQYENRLRVSKKVAGMRSSRNAMSCSRQRQKKGRTKKPGKVCDDAPPPPHTHTHPVTLRHRCRRYDDNTASLTKLRKHLYAKKAVYA
jgi:hypothetical protein